MKRWPLYAAIVYVALIVGALFVVSSVPDVGAPGERLVRYYRDNAAGIRMVTWLTAVSTIPLVLLVAHLRSRLAGIGRDVLLLGAAGFVLSTILSSWIGAGLALHAGALDPNVARGLANVNAYFGPVLTVSIILLIAPVGLAAWRGEGGFPRWLAVLTAVFAVEQSIETITIFGTEGFIAPGGAMNFVLGAGLYCVWVLAAGVASRAAEDNVHTVTAPSR